MALTDDPVPGETPLTEADLKGLRLPFITTRGQLSVVEGTNIVGGKQWALASPSSRLPNMLTTQYLQELHRKMFGDVWEWAGEIRRGELQNAFASMVPDIRSHLEMLFKDATEYWLQDSSMSPDELAVRVHHRVVKVHPFCNGNGRHARLLADLLLEKHFGLKPLAWGASGDLGNSDPLRQLYLDGLRAADKGDYQPLLKLSRSS